MSGIHFYNWDDGSVAVESAIVHIHASRLGTPRAIMSTTIAVDPAYLHHVGRPETEDVYGIETISAALAAKVAADFPDGANPVETSVEIEYRLDAVGPRREDGGRMPSGGWVDLAVPCSREEVDAAREKLSKSVIDGLDAAAKYFAAEAAAGSRADA